MKQFTAADLIAFGNYLLSSTRGERINSENNPNADKVQDTDIANWQNTLVVSQVPTRGQQVMSVSFNPGQREDVAAIKQVFADAYNEIEKWVIAKTQGPAMLENQQAQDVHRLAAIAKTNLETAQMYAVKAVTR